MITPIDCVFITLIGLFSLGLIGALILVIALAFGDWTDPQDDGR